MQQRFTPLILLFLLFQPIIAMQMGRMSPPLTNPYPSIWQSAKDGNIAAIEWYLAFPTIDVNKNTDQKGQTALHWATRQGHIEIAKLLLNRGANPNQPDYQRKTPLHCTVMSCQIEASRLLLNQRADPNSIDFKKRTPLHWVVRMTAGSVKKSLPQMESSTAVELIKILRLKGAIDTEDLENKTPLDWAMQNNQKVLVKALQSDQIEKPNNAVSSGSILDKKKESLLNELHTNQQCIKSGSTLLQLAAMRGEKDVVDNLLETGENPDTTDLNGMTALHYAMQSGQSKIVKSLLNNKANVNAQDLKKRTALHLLVLMTEKIQENPCGFSLDKIEIDDAITIMKKSVSVIEEEKDTEIKRPLYDERKIQKQLLDIHLDVFDKANNGVKPINQSTTRNIINALKHKNADTTLKDCYGKTAADWAQDTKLTNLLKPTITQ